MLRLKQQNAKEWPKMVVTDARDVHDKLSTEKGGLPQQKALTLDFATIRECYHWGQKKAKLTLFFFELMLANSWLTYVRRPCQTCASFFVSMFVTGLFFQRHVVRCAVLCLSPLSPCRPVSVSPFSPSPPVHVFMVYFLVLCVSVFELSC